MLNKSDLIGIVESAFKPLDCIVEFSRYKNLFGFRVYLPDGKHITRKKSNTTILLNEHQLSSTISGVRTLIEDKGIALDKWSFPKTES